MKIRNGFVSNSSSSSFIIGFDKKPEFIYEMKEALFPDKEQIEHPFEDILISAIKISKTVLNDIEKQSPMDAKEIAEILSYGYSKKGPQFDDYKDSKGDIDWKSHEKEKLEYNTKLAKKLMENHKGKVFFTVSYSDNDSSYDCAMEHGDMFHNIVYIRISCH